METAFENLQVSESKKIQGFKVDFGKRAQVDVKLIYRPDDKLSAVYRVRFRLHNHTFYLDHHTGVDELIEAFFLKDFTDSVLEAWGYTRDQDAVWSEPKDHAQRIQILKKTLEDLFVLLDQVFEENGITLFEFASWFNGPFRHDRGSYEHRLMKIFIDSLFYPGGDLKNPDD